MPRREFDLRKATPKEDVSELYRLIASEPKAVLANPIWRRLQKRDPDFLAKTPPSFRLGLLRHHFRTHKKNPWKLLSHAGQREPAWPMWKGPIWDYSRNDIIDPNEQEGLRSRLIPLAGGWGFQFCAEPAAVQFEDGGYGPDPDERYRLDRVLKRLFTTSGADPRRALSKYTPELMPCGGNSGLSFVGVLVISPGGFECLAQSGDLFFAEVDGADSVLISTLSAEAGRYRRIVAAGEDPRPLFATGPTIDESMQLEGGLTCRWETDYYLPIDPEPGDSSWRYERHPLSVEAYLWATAVADLAELGWKYQTIGDLESLIARAIAGKSAHRLLLPIYEAMLFGSRK
jgi:hypothetical protein